MTNTPQFKIYGEERRILKKKLFALRSYVRNFWHSYQLDKDMASFFGGCEGYPMTDEEARRKFDLAKRDVEVIGALLAEPYVMQH